MDLIFFLLDQLQMLLAEVFQLVHLGCDVAHLTIDAPHVGLVAGILTLEIRLVSRRPLDFKTPNIPLIFRQPLLESPFPLIQK